MRLRRLRLINFRQHADTTLEFEAGLTGIIGPNGAGKSTLLEAIAWAMYGTPAARGTLDSIRRRNAPPRSRVEVELEFVLGIHQYRVVRSFHQAALYQDGDDVPVANSAAAVTDKVSRLLRMTKEEFFNTYFTEQKQLAFMAGLKASGRAKFLSRLLGYERLAAVQVKLSEERSALRAALQTAETGLIDLAELEREEQAAVNRIALAERSVATTSAHQRAAEAAVVKLGPEWEAIQRRREVAQATETDLSIANHAAIEARRTFESLDRDLTESLEAKAKRDELAPATLEWDALVADRNRLDGLAQSFAGRLALEAKVTMVEKTVAELDQRLGQLPDRERVEQAKAAAALAQQQADAAAAVVEDERTNWVRNKQDAETMRKGLLQQHEDVETQQTRLADAGPTGVCPTCGKPLGKEYEAVLDDLVVKLELIASDGRHYRDRIKQLSPEPKELAQARLLTEHAERDLKAATTAAARAEAAVAERTRAEAARAEGVEQLGALRHQLAETPTEYDKALHLRVRERLGLLEPMREQVVRLTARAERAAELVPKALEAEQTLTRIEVEVAELTGRLVALGWSAAAYEHLRVAYVTADREREAAVLSAVRAAGERSGAIEHRAAVARRRDDRTRRVGEVDRLKGDVLLNQELDRAFSDLRDDLNATLRPELADAASVLLRELSAGRYSDLELGEDYTASIVDDGEPKTVISGGEEDIVNLALRLAISQMIADRAGQPFSLLVLDEIFGSLDEERRNAVVDLLRGLADRFPQVVLITHIESVRDGFDRIIRIDYDVERGLATAREEPPGTLEIPGAAA